jgi:hypothetical protein
MSVFTTHVDDTCIHFLNTQPCAVQKTKQIHCSSTMSQLLYLTIYSHHLRISLWTHSALHTLWDHREQAHHLLSA